MPATETTITIPASRLADARAKVNRFSRRAAKLGLADVGIASERAFVEYKLIGRRGTDSHEVGPLADAIPEIPSEPWAADYKWTTHARNMIEIVIVGERPVFRGWEFAAVIEPTGSDAGNMIRKSPVFVGDLPASFRHCDPYHCDHCKTDRKRSETFVVRSTETGECKQVGRSCIGDFTGAGSPDVWLHFATMEQIVSEIAGWSEDGGGWGATTIIRRDEFLRCVAAAVRLDGYVSASQARDRWGATATGQAVWLCLGSDKQEDRDFARDRVTDADRKLVADAIAWITGLDVATLSDYEHNLRVAIGAEIVPMKRCNLLASLIPAYRRHAGIQAEGKAARVNEHIGSVGDKIADVPATYVRSASWDSDFGVQFSHTFHDAQGRTITWKTGTPIDESIPVGGPCFVSGKIKEHGEYQGRMYTRLTHATVVCPSCADVLTMDCATAGATKLGRGFKSAKGSERIAAPAPDVCAGDEWFFFWAECG